MMEKYHRSAQKGIRVILVMYGMLKLVTYVALEFHRNVYSKQTGFAPYFLIEKLAHVSGTYS